MKRRRFLAVLSLAFMTPSWAGARMRLTASDAEGPFYPVEDIPLRPDLVLEPARINGTPLLLEGRVVNPQGQPQANVKVEIWQCDGAGLYHHPKQENTNQHDPHFAGNGAVLTDKKGSYQFYTLYPVPYGARPPHIHIKVWQGNDELLTTQLYLQGQTGNEWWGKNRELLQLSPGKNQRDVWTANFDFVV
ncbi:protocatechuate 3,4-dioxygenase [Photobacterium minamisatsumaniensis]|uniref:dioxygenase family protein n=1 Tax=Photobacterium minamisatsumaniensis TaxID=2910233 RepID=UPI003D0C4C74